MKDAAARQTQAVTVRLSASAYEQLLAEARRRGRPLATVLKERLAQASGRLLPPQHARVRALLTQCNALGTLAATCGEYAGTPAFGDEVKQVAQALVALLNDLCQ